MKKVLIGILIGLIVGVGCLFVYNEFFVKKDDSKTEENETKEKVKDEIKEEIGEELDVNSEQVTGLIEKVNFVNDSLSAGDKFGYFYKKDKYSLTDISDEVKIYLGVSTLGYDRLSAAGTITKSEMDSLVQSVFGKNATYNDVNVKGCVALNYDASNNSYSIVPPECGGTLIPYYGTKIVSAKKYSDRIEIEEKAIYLMANTENENMITVNIYKPNKTDLIVENELFESLSRYSNVSNYDQYFDQTDTYKYVFKLEDGNYYFESVEKIN